MNDLVRTRIDNLETNQAAMKKQLIELGKKVDRAKVISNVGGGSSGVDSGAFSDLIDELSRLRTETESLRGEVSKQIKQLNDGLDDKASKHDLSMLEQRMQDRL